MAENFLEPLGPQDGDHEIEKQGDGDHAEDEGFHGRVRDGRFGGPCQRTFSQK
jgi:hypothetical protein